MPERTFAAAFAAVALAILFLVLGCMSARAAAADILLMSRVRAEITRGATGNAIVLLEAAVKDQGARAEVRLALLGELAPLYLSAGKFADAGEAFAYEAELTARLNGAADPRLFKIYESAGDAYARAGDARKAIHFFEEALRIDMLYGDCAGNATARLHERLARAYGALNETEKASRHRRLSEDAGLRCAEPGAASGTRGIVVTSEFAAADRDSFTRVKVFYATDRARTGSDRPNDFYGGARGDLDFGTLDVTVPRIHKPGALEAPSLTKLEWRENPERHIVIMRLETMSGDELFADMARTLGGRGAEEAFVFIHGYNVSFADAAKRTAQIAYDLNFEGAPILYSWPSRANLLFYLSDEAVVRLSGRRLRGFLEDVVARSGAKRVHLIAHSMGNRALIDALELIAAERRGMADGVSPMFEQIIFTAPDEDAGLFAEMIRSVRPLARRLTLYTSDQDWALAASRELHGDAPRAGEAGEKILIADEIDSIDMSALGEDMLGHSYFANDTSALTDILWLFWKDAAPEGRCGLQPLAAPRGRYWVFDAVRCNGPVAMSALTLARAKGEAAFSTVDRALAELAGRPNSAEAVQEWRAIRGMLARIVGR
ncbi:MAG: alpha/beta fold hydrolase [Hyphomicrobiales bacterium]|nr:alpha/beta fold hydrolase [Hyphomicrobiales bacterium]